MADINKALERVRKEIERIEKKENKIFFFVYDTKGYPSGSLGYIYDLALILNEDGYNVEMLYQENPDSPFEGVGAWLEEKYTKLTHTNVASDELNVTPTDILFIPEIFAQVMNQTKKLPCKRIAILQNFDYMVEQMPFSAQWGDFGILDAITNTDYNASLIKSVFPYVTTTTITPFISDKFGTTSQPKEMVINILSQDQANINKVVKQFYWKYPTYKWVSFKDLRGLPKDEFANALRTGAITIWIDEDASFGYSALEAMKSGAIVIAKVPKNDLPWVNTENDKLTNAAIWFEDINSVHKTIASAVRSWTTDRVPEKLFVEASECVKKYTYEATKNAIIKYVTGINESRKAELNNILNEFEKNDGK